MFLASEVGVSGGSNSEVFDLFVGLILADLDEEVPTVGLTLVHFELLRRIFHTFKYGKFPSVA